MIAKHVPMRSLGKSNFADLANYLTDEQSKEHRLGAVNVTNCESANLKAAIEEILATQHINTRAKSDKTYHLIVSFRAGEEISDDVLKAIEDRICAGLGFGEHQRVSAVHTDTDNLHIHIAINKIHPEKGTIHEPYYPHRTLSELCELCERDYGLERDNHMPNKRGAAGRAQDMERHAGVESLVGWIKRECLTEIRAATTWEQLHKVLGENGLTLRERGNGLVFESSDGTAVKGSTLSRDLSKPALEAKFGAFISSSGEGKSKAKRTYDKKPVRSRVNTTELYARYRKEQKNLTADRAEALERARRNKDKAVENARRANSLRRATIKVVDSKGINKKVLYAQAFSAYRAKLDTIHQEYAKERELLFKGFQRRTWADWLKHEAQNGNQQALNALRARDSAKGLQGNTITGQGTIIYRAGQSAVRDDGDRLQVSANADREALTAALKIATERYAGRITVNGTPEFKAQMIRAAVDSQLPITFADPGLELRRQELLNKKEQDDARRREPDDRGRADRRSDGRDGSRTTAHSRNDGGGNNPRPAGRERSAGGVDTTRDNRKPNVGRIGRVPPPESKNRLRALSKLGVVRIARGGEVLLPGHVPGHVEHQRSKPDHELRRGVSGAGGVTPPGYSPSSVIDNITKKGTIIYRAGQSAVRDDGDRLQVSTATTPELLSAALDMAAKRYGSCITVNGTPEFKAQMIRAAVDSQLPITFADPGLELRRQELLNKKEQDDARRREPDDRGRADRRSDGRDGSRTTAHSRNDGGGNNPRPAGRERSAGGVDTTRDNRKPNVGRIGRVPPPESKNRLRALSKLGVVRIASGGEVLLPGHVPGHVEHQGSKPDHALQRGVSGTGGVTKALGAADKYIAEREAKRLLGFDISKHCRYNAEGGTLTFAGVRRIEDQALALLKRSDEDTVFVMPIDTATANRLKKISIGDAVSVTPKGSIKTSKGRSR